MGAQIEGSAAATYTGFKADGSVDLDVVESEAANLVRQGVRYAFVNGTSGESMSLSFEERKALHAAWVAAAKKQGGALKVIAHVGTPSVQETKELAAHAQEVGCDAVSAMPPVFFKASGVKALALWLKEAASGAPKLPFYYYHFPNITSVDLVLVDLFAAIEEVGIPTFRGTKNTCHDMHRYDMSVRYGGGRYDCALGRDEAHLSGLVLGTYGAIGNAFNYMNGAFEAMRTAFHAGDIATARRWQNRVNDFVRIILLPKFKGGVQATKAAHELATGAKLGPTRLPLLPLSHAEVEDLRAELTSIGFFAWKDGKDVDA